MIILSREAAIIALTDASLLFLSILYVNYKFREIFEEMKKSIETKNRRMMYCSVIKHSKASDLTPQFECLYQLCDWFDLYNRISFSCDFVHLCLWPVPQLWCQSILDIYLHPFKFGSLYGKPYGGVGDDWKRIRCQTFVSDFHWESIQRFVSQY